MTRLGGQSTVLHDDGTERAFVGGLPHYPDRLEDIAPQLMPEHFYRPAHQTLFQVERELIEEGTTGPFDFILLLDRCRGKDPGFPEDLLVGALTDGIAPRREHAEIIFRLAAARRVLALTTLAQHDLAETGDPYGVAARTAKDLDAVGVPASDKPEALTLPELVERADQVAPWVVPGLLRLDWRAIVVAGEGKGKSTLLRQLAVCSAQGIHPLKFSTMPPVRTLIVDGENSVAAIAETGARLDQAARCAAGERYEADRCRVWCLRPGRPALRRL